MRLIGALLIFTLLALPRLNAREMPGSRRVSGRRDDSSRLASNSPISRLAILLDKKANIDCEDHSGYAAEGLGQHWKCRSRNGTGGSRRKRDKGGGGIGGVSSREKQARHAEARGGSGGRNPGGIIQSGDNGADNRKNLSGKTTAGITRTTPHLSAHERKSSSGSDSSRSRGSKYRQRQGASSRPHSQDRNERRRLKSQDTYPPYTPYTPEPPGVPPTPLSAAPPLQTPPPLSPLKPDMPAATPVNPDQLTAPPTPTPTQEQQQQQLLLLPPAPAGFGSTPSTSALPLMPPAAPNNNFEDFAPPPPPPPHLEDTKQSVAPPLPSPPPTAPLPPPPTYPFQNPSTAANLTPWPEPMGSQPPLPLSNSSRTDGMTGDAPSVGSDGVRPSSPLGQPLHPSHTMTLMTESTTKTDIILAAMAGTLGVLTVLMFMFTVSRIRKALLSGRCKESSFKFTAPVGRSGGAVGTPAKPSRKGALYDPDGASATEMSPLTTGTRKAESAAKLRYSIGGVFSAKKTSSGGDGTVGGGGLTSRGTSNGGGGGAAAGVNLDMCHNLLYDMYETDNSPDFCNKGVPSALARGGGRDTGSGRGGRSYGGGRGGAGQASAQEMNKVARSLTVDMTRTSPRHEYPAAPGKDRARGSSGSGRDSGAAVNGSDVTARAVSDQRRTFEHLQLPAAAAAALAGYTADGRGADAFVVVGRCHGPALVRRRGEGEEEGSDAAPRGSRGSRGGGSGRRRESSAALRSGARSRRPSGVDSKEEESHGTSGSDGDHGPPCNGRKHYVKAGASSDNGFGAGGGHGTAGLVGAGAAATRRGPSGGKSDGVGAKAASCTAHALRGITTDLLARGAVSYAGTPPATATAAAAPSAAGFLSRPPRPSSGAGAGSAVVLAAGQLMKQQGPQPLRRPPVAARAGAAQPAPGSAAAAALRSRLEAAPRAATANRQPSQTSNDDDDASTATGSTSESEINGDGDGTHAGKASAVPLLLRLLQRSGGKPKDTKALAAAAAAPAATSKLPPRAALPTRRVRRSSPISDDTGGSSSCEDSSDGDAPAARKGMEGPSAPQALAASAGIRPTGATRGSVCRSEQVNNSREGGRSRTSEAITKPLPLRCSGRAVTAGRVAIDERPVRSSGSIAQSGKRLVHEGESDGSSSSSSDDGDDSNEDEYDEDGTEAARQPLAASDRRRQQQQWLRKSTGKQRGHGSR